MSNLKKTISSDQIICSNEASRLYHAIRFHARHQHTLKISFWENLMIQLVHRTKNKHLVPVHMTADEWYYYSELAKIDSST